MESQKELQRDFFEQQSKLNNEYFEKQKAWEEKVMQKEEEIALADRASNEFMMNNILKLMERQINHTNLYTPTMHIPATYQSNSYMQLPSTSYTDLPSNSKSTQQLFPSSFQDGQD